MENKVVDKDKKLDIKKEKKISKRKAEPSQEVATVTSETIKIKKSSITASTLYDYKKIVFPQEYFLDCDLEEDREDLILTFQLDGYKSFQNIHVEPLVKRVTILRSVGKLEKLAKEFCFELNPSNLFYDINGQVKVKIRDIYEKGHFYEEEKFTLQYRSLIGFGLQKKYTYEDYRDGGQDLLKKEKATQDYFSLNKVSEIEHGLERDYEKLLSLQKKTKIEVNKQGYLSMRIYFIIATILWLGFGGYTLYLMTFVQPVKEAFITANNAYIEKDYAGIIDSLKVISVDKLDVHQKYILADAYVKTEALSDKQREKIKSVLTLENIQMLNYWINLGRGNIDEAVNIAMLQSDDSLLLYAYMKDKSMTEANETMTGEEKTTKLSELDGKMKPLLEKYEDKEE